MPGSLSLSTWVENGVNCRVNSRVNHRVNRGVNIGMKYGRAGAKVYVPARQALVDADFRCNRAVRMLGNRYYLDCDARHAANAKSSC
jgi:hypothetical protein